MNKKSVLVKTVIEDLSYHSIDTLFNKLVELREEGFNAMEAYSYDRYGEDRCSIEFKKYIEESDEDFQLRIAAAQEAAENKRRLEEDEKRAKRYEKYLILKAEFDK